MYILELKIVNSNTLLFKSIRPNQHSALQKITNL
jgi:hypothetical protein